ncbi:MAG: hypothetical protein WA395_14900 [Nitrososphaeraceae archaeon]
MIGYPVMPSTNKNHHEESDSSYTCEVCATSFDSRSELADLIASLCTSYSYYICVYNALNTSVLRNIRLIVTDAQVYFMFMTNAMTGTITIVKADSKNDLDDIDNNSATDSIID